MEGNFTYKLILVGSLVLSIFLFFVIGGMVGNLVAVLVLVFAIWVTGIYEYRSKINRYAKMFDDIYVVSNNPETGEQVRLPAQFDNFVIYSPYDTVMETVAIQGEWLELSGNEFYCDESLSEAQQIKIIPLILQDGKNVNESWEEFCWRVETTIKNDRAKRHEYLKSVNEGWYHLHGNHQKGIIVE